MINFHRFNTSKLHKSFINREPFDHIIIDNFLEIDHAELLVQEVNTYKDMLDHEYTTREKDCEVQSKKIGISDYNKFGPKVKEFIDISKSPEMIQFISSITGIEDLKADTSLFGGGIHRTATGGRLEIHADFNIHPYTKQHRRVNALLYLNKDWKPEYKGELELWDKTMHTCCNRIAPLFNRFVIFRITDTAFHGHPEYWAGPLNTPRLSIALYYYTEDRPDHEKAPFHMALWQKRII